MGSLAIAGKLAIFEIGNVKPPEIVGLTFTPLTEVVEIGELNFSRGRYDATFHSPSIYRALMIGLADPIEIALTLNYVKPQYEILWELANNTDSDGPLEWFRLLWPDGSFHVIEAFVAGINSATPLDERITYQVTLAATQDIVFTAAP